jgi:hypothetical protein
MVDFETDEKYNFNSESKPYALLKEPYGLGEKYGEKEKEVDATITPDLAHFTYQVHVDGIYLSHMVVNNRRQGIGSEIIGYLLSESEKMNKDVIGGFIGGGKNTQSFLEKNGFSQAEFNFWTSTEDWEVFKEDSAPKLNGFPNRCVTGNRIKKECMTNQKWWDYGYSVWFLDNVPEVISERSGAFPLIDRKSPLADRIKRRLNR